MALQDEMTFQRIEVLLDIQAKKILAEVQKLREELSQAKEELRKEIHSVRQDASFQAGRVQMYAEAPAHQEAAPVPRYAQDPQWQQPMHQPYPGQYPEQPVQQWAQAPQQAPQPAQTWNQPYPPQMRGGDKPVETKPIDRNGVAPSEVSVEKFFYSGSKKK